MAIPLKALFHVDLCGLGTRLAFSLAISPEATFEKHGDALMSMGPGGLLGGGGFYNPQGAYGPWGGCGCSSVFIILAGILLIFGGCFRMLGH
jgi:hypothetical protein